MVLGEFATAHDLGKPLVVCFLVDERLGLIEVKQAAMGLKRASVRFAGRDFVGIADAIGAMSSRPTMPSHSPARREPPSREKTPP